MRRFLLQRYTSQDAPGLDGYGRLCTCLRLFAVSWLTGGTTQPGVVVSLCIHRPEIFIQALDAAKRTEPQIYANSRKFLEREVGSDLNRECTRMDANIQLLLTDMGRTRILENHNGPTRIHTDQWRSRCGLEPVGRQRWEHDAWHWLRVMLWQVFG